VPTMVSLNVGHRGEGVCSTTFLLGIGSGRVGFQWQSYGFYEFACASELRTKSTLIKRCLNALLQPRRFEIRDANKPMFDQAL
jgi:hypothetical protein